MFCDGRGVLFALSLWDRGVDEIFCRRYPLHRASRDGDVGFVVQSLMLDGTANLEYFDRFLGWTPAHWAAFFGQVL
jgi:ankyrin repeat protein